MQSGGLVSIPVDLPWDLCSSSCMVIISRCVEILSTSQTKLSESRACFGIQLGGDGGGGGGISFARQYLIASVSSPLFPHVDALHAIFTRGPLEKKQTQMNQSICC